MKSLQEYLNESLNESISLGTLAGGYIIAKVALWLVGLFALFDLYHGWHTLVKNDVDIVSSHNPIKHIKANKSLGAGLITWIARLWKDKNDINNNAVIQQYVSKVKNDPRFKQFVKDNEDHVNFTKLRHLIEDIVDTKNDQLQTAVAEIWREYVGDDNKILQNKRDFDKAELEMEEVMK